LEEAQVAKDCVYMQMPVQDVSQAFAVPHCGTDICIQYGTLQFSKFEEILEVGYRAAVEMLQKFHDEGKLPPMTLDGHAEVKKKGRSARRNSI
jgi:lysophospholipid hydrolase